MNDRIDYKIILRPIFPEKFDKEILEAAPRVLYRSTIVEYATIAVGLAEYDEKYKGIDPAVALFDFYNSSIINGAHTSSLSVNALRLLCGTKGGVSILNHEIKMQQNFEKLFKNKIPEEDFPKLISENDQIWEEIMEIIEATQQISQEDIQKSKKN